MDDHRDLPLQHRLLHGRDDTAHIRNVYVSKSRWTGEEPWNACEEADMTVFAKTIPNTPIQYNQAEIDTSNPFALGCSFIGGAFVPTAQASVPIFDAGYVHSDVTYTVAHVWHGNIFRLGDHVDRLLDGAREMRLASPYDREQIMKLMKACVARSGLRESFVNVSLTRGYADPPWDRRLSALKPQLYIYTLPYVWAFLPEKQINGVSAVLARTVRRTSANSIDARIKNFQWGDLTRGAFEALDRGADTAFLLDTDGYVCEGPGYNVCVVKDGQIFSASRNALPGVTRRTVFEIAQSLQLPVTLGDVPQQLVFEADEIFLATTAGGVTPVIAFEGKPIGDGRPGKITSRIQERFWSLMDEPSDLIEAIDYVRDQQV